MRARSALVMGRGGMIPWWGQDHRHAGLTGKCVCALRPPLERISPGQSPRQALGTPAPRCARAMQGMHGEYAGIALDNAQIGAHVGLVKEENLPCELLSPA
jgi:hypothetical protein